MVRRAALVLAGGRGRRFQTIDKVWMDKALALLDGKPLLIHTVENVSRVVDEVIIIVNDNEQRKTLYEFTLAKYNIKNAKIAVDLKIDGLSGPIVAILTGLGFADAEYCLTVPADMPLVNPKVINYLFTQIDGSYVAVPMWPNGRLETLLMILKRREALEIANVLCKLGRSHPDDIIRGICHVLFVSPLGEIKDLDPQLKSFININSMEDLRRLQPRQTQGSQVENFRLNLCNPPFDQIPPLIKAAANSSKGNFLDAANVFSDSASKFSKADLFFWAALSLEFEAKSLLGYQVAESSSRAKTSFHRAAENYGLESELYGKNHCAVLAERAKSDMLWCQTQAQKLED